MKILVTGGAGYVGSTLVPMLLQQGHEVKVLDNLMYGGAGVLPLFGLPGFDFVRGDVCDPATLKRALRGSDAIIHLAAIVGYPACKRDPLLASKVNLEATRLLDALREPLESGNVTIARAGFQISVPAAFQLVLATNPCPCGNALDTHRGAVCRCTPTQRRRYLSRLSGPLLDRVDVRVVLTRPSLASLAADADAADHQAAAAQRNVFHAVGSPVEVG